MKLKLKLDQKTILNFLLQNVEKIVLVVIALIFVLMLYSSLTSAGHFDKTPEQMQTAATTARRDVDSTTFEDYVKEREANAPTTSTSTDESNASGEPAAPSTNTNLAVLDYVGRAKQSRVKIEEKPFVTPVAFDPPLFPKSPLRDAPPLFSVQQLHCAGSIGAFRITPVAREEQTERSGRTERSSRSEATMSVSGGEQLRGQRWIVVTGLVPIQKQELAYADTFKLSSGYDPQNDYPKYLGYWVERVEVDGTNEAAPDWSKATTFISRKAIDSATQEWSSSSSLEVVAPEYIEETLTFPLGPLVNHNWDATVAHEPEIPLQTTGVPGQGGNMPGPMGGALRGNARGLGPMGPMGGIMGGRMPSPTRGLSAGPAGSRAGQQDNSAEDTPFGTKSSNSDNPSSNENAAANEQDKGPPAYKLFRFFDFDVESGKRYVYRVRLALSNPNFDVKESFLKSPDLAKEKYLKTKWSEPSAAISTPRNTRVLLASVKPSRNNSDFSGEILMTTWVQRKGIEIFKEFTVTRGQVANYSDETGKSVGGADMPESSAPSMLGPGGLSGRVPTEGTKKEGTKKDSTKKEGAGKTPAKADRTKTRTGEGAPGRGLGALLGDIGSGLGRTPQPLAAGSTFKADFISDATAIDFHGGERLAGRGGNALTVPGEMLLLDADGYLVVRNELDDQSARDDIKNQTKSAAGSADGPQGLLLRGRPTGLGGF